MVAIERLRRSTPLRLARGWLEHRADASQALGRVERLPLYQIALWPDGWEWGRGQSLIVRETHEMAEARRWYAMAARNGAVVPGRPSPTRSRTMHLYGIGVPSEILGLVGRRFASEQAASVAIRLIASDWVEQRRRMLARDPARMLALQAQTWSGSCHGSLAEPAELCPLVLRLLDLCIAEGLLPAAETLVDRETWLNASGPNASGPVRTPSREPKKPLAHADVRVDDGYGLTTWHCRVLVELDQSLARPITRSIAEALELALIPWNRTVLRDDRPWRLLQIEVVNRCLVR